MVKGVKMRLSGCVGMVVSCFLLLGCDAETNTVAYKPSTDIHSFMVWQLEPAADVLWDSAGFIVTAEGEEDLQPTTEAGWNAVRNSATVVAESGNLLMMPGYAADQEDWAEYSSALVDAGMVARDAARAKDAEALFQAGARLYSVCKACHNRYIVQAAESM